MQRYRDVVLNSRGEPVRGVSVLVLTYPDGDLADLFSDDAGAVLANPVTSDPNGAFSFKAANGHYSLVISGTGVTTQTVNDIALNDAEDAVSDAVTAAKAELAASSGSSLVTWIRNALGAVKTTLAQWLNWQPPSVLDFMSEAERADVLSGALALDHTAAAQAALNSGAGRVVGGGKSYRVTTLTLPAGVIFDGQGGQLLSSGSTVQDVVQTAGHGCTLQNWFIGSNVAGTRKGRYGVLVSHNGVKLRNLYIKDINYSAVFNDAAGTDGFDITGENCGWDTISNYTNAAFASWRKISGYRNGRSLVSTDPGAKGIVLDGFYAEDSGLDAIADQHKDVLHFEYATDCVFKNGVIRYTAGYTGGTIAQTWAMLRFNASTNCVIENVDIKAESSVNGRLQLALVDKTGADGNTLCGAYNINVNAQAISGYALKFLSLDGSARFRLVGGTWWGQVTVESAVAGGNAFEHIANIDANGPGSNTFMTSQYITNDWTIEGIKLRGYNTAFFLNGFQDSSIKHCEIEGAAFGAFNLVNSNAGAGYQPNGGVIAHNVIRGTTGTVLQTNNQTRSLGFVGNTIDGSATLGLNTAGGTAGATTSSVKAIGNLVTGTLATAQSGGTNTPGALNANMNNLSI